MSAGAAENPGRAGAGLPLCAGAELAERGRALLFDVRLWGREASAFVLRFEGRAVAYVNRCAHVPTEMDWQPGEFLDAEREWIVCAVHGALYDPVSGRCVGGPCRGARLIAVPVEEVEGRVYWYPTEAVQPPAAARP